VTHAAHRSVTRVHHALPNPQRELRYRFYYRLRQARSVPVGQTYEHAPSGMGAFLPIRIQHVWEAKVSQNRLKGFVVMHWCCDARGAVAGVTSRLGGDERTSVELPTLRRTHLNATKAESASGTCFPQRG
jgi:hypothetical protein